MNIIEATKKALEENKWIANSQMRKYESAVYPTNSSQCFLVRVVGENTSYGKRWNPTSDDILDDTYELID